MTRPTRRGFLRAGGLLAAGALAPPLRAAAQPGAGAAPEASPAELELVTSPRRVFRVTADANREHMDGWLTTLVLRSIAVGPVEPEELVVSYRQGDAERVVIRYAGGTLAGLNMVTAPAAASGRPAGPPFAMRLTSLQPQSLGIDRARCELVVHRGGGRRVRVTKEIPLEIFEQKTALLFPFRGCGIFTQGGALNDGHRNRSGQFAVDAMALSDLYAVMARDGESSDSVAGWGRPILAPAAGVVVVARADRPDQPTIGNADPKYFVPEFPDGGDPGNHVVIDHENGEFSMIAHFQKDTLKPKVGDRVAAAEPLGLLGSSGDSSAPHVHHQLQSGPNWTSADALPHHYTNGPLNHHDRGAMFRAR